MDNYRYYTSFDGFRGIAVIFVLLVHLNLYVFNFLWIGVPMFFVLSGYLITKILLLNKSSNNYFSVFYFRRLLRIFPIYYLVLFFSLGWGYFMNYNTSQFYYYLFYLQSFLISNQISPIYCNTILSHTWSLSVEELFYFFWPALVYFTNKNYILKICILLIIISLIYKLSLIESGSETKALLSLLGNSDCLMIGVLLSLLKTEYNFYLSFKIQKNILLFLLLLIISLVIAQFIITNFKIIFLIKILLSFFVSWISFFLLNYFTTYPDNKSPLNTFFQHKYLIYIGKISYGIYLYHFVVYIFFDSFLYHYNFTLNPFYLLIFKLFFTFLIAHISWHLIEKRILMYKEIKKY